MFLSSAKKLPHIEEYTKITTLSTAVLFLFRAQISAAELVISAPRSHAMVTETSKKTPEDLGEIFMDSY